LEADRKIRTHFKEVAEKLEGKKDYIKTKFASTDEFKEACNHVNKTPDEILNFCCSWVCRETNKMGYENMP